VALTGGIARLDGKGVDEEVEEDDIAFCAGGIGLGGRGEAMRRDERGVNVVQQVSPHLPNV
jgi:hypothetical protein